MSELDKAALGILDRFSRIDSSDKREVIEFLKAENIISTQDEFIEAKDDTYPLRKITQGTVPGGVSADKVYEIQKAQKKLEQAVQQLKKPPEDYSKYSSKVKEDLKKSLELHDQREREFWKRDRLFYIGRTLNVNPENALSLAKKALEGKESSTVQERAKAITKGLWENNDYTHRRVFRMEEILGVLGYSKTITNEQERKNFKQAFFKEMGDYIKNEFGNEGQFTFDSLLALIQSTDWSGTDNDELEAFSKELAEGVAQTGNFAGKLPQGFGKENGVVVGNYNGDYDDKTYGSLALIRYKEKDDKGNEVTKFLWLEYDTASQLNKIKYTFDNGKPSFEQGGGGTPAPTDAPASVAKSTGGPAPAPPKPTILSDETKEKLRGALKTISDNHNKLQEYLKLKQGDVVVPLTDIESLQAVQKSLSQVKSNLDLANSIIAQGGQVDSNILGILKNLVESLKSTAQELEKLLKEQSVADKQRASVLRDEAAKIEEILKEQDLRT